MEHFCHLYFLLKFYIGLPRLVRSLVVEQVFCSLCERGGSPRGSVEKEAFVVRDLLLFYSERLRYLV